jgi:hypothetical protein
MFVTVSLLLVAACLVPAAAKLLSHPKMRHAAAHFTFGPCPSRSASSASVPSLS